MGDFFDSVSDTYDEVHTAHIDRGEEYYMAISNPFESTSKKVKILNLGCGTGLDLASILKKTPNATLCCIDLSQKMLSILEERYSAGSHSITKHLVSYLDFEYSPNEYDYILASSTLHHLLDKEKSDLFQKLFNALKNNGYLVLGDYYVSDDEAKEYLELYFNFKSKGIDISEGKYHIDIPTTRESEIDLLNRSGFKGIETIWESANFSIITARKNIYSGHLDTIKDIPE